jgi:hypothetical protein
MTFLSKFRKQVCHVSAELTLHPGGIDAGSGYADTVLIPEAKVGDLIIHTHGADHLTSLVVAGARVDADGVVLLRFANTSNQLLKWDHPLTLHFLLVKGLG